MGHDRPTDELIRQLRQTLGTDAVQTPSDGWQDICRFDLGTPAAVVTPDSIGSAQRVVEIARRMHAPLVPVSRRTAYWRPLHLQDCIAVQLDHLDDVKLCDEFVVCGAGTTVRALDEALRQQGDHLPIHPDAFGDTSIGAMVATGCTSGIGMCNGPLSRWITGLTVITGTGDLLRTGSASALQDNPPFMRDGLPDSTGAFIGSEGCLGLVVEVALQRVPAPWRVHLQWRTADPLPLVALGRDLARRGLVDTVRILREVEPDAEPEVDWTCDIWVQSALSAEEASQRATAVCARVTLETGATPTTTAESEDARTGQSPDYDARFNGTPEQHWASAAHSHMVGMDVNAPYDQTEALLEVALAAARDQIAQSAHMARTAIYLAADFVNIGIHGALPTDAASIAWSRTHQAETLEKLAARTVVPYRVGRVWPKAMTDRLDPVHRRWLMDVKDMFDPDHLFNPGHRLFDPT